MTVLGDLINAGRKGFACHRVMKVARTIADLDGATSIARVHAAEALNDRFRPSGATTAASRARPVSPSASAFPARSI